MDVVVRHWFGVYLTSVWVEAILNAQDEVLADRFDHFDTKECKENFGFYLSQIAIEVGCHLHPEAPQYLFVFDVVNSHGQQTYGVSLQTHHVNLRTPNISHYTLDEPFAELTVDDIQHFVTFFEFLGVNPLEVYTSRFTFEVSLPAKWHYTQSLECQRRS